ncbi:putative ubiquitin-protein ligase BRE1 [Schistosoma mansoni]|uniref:putative ubiquitin-protein ligase BRE1 n=1 Tax=Schistosoma mansoni TaxID=6183 RepID=UPI0001A644BB|nr:putative ubiquitin-protein ligase BRE1 [Schistosoma mansoni]|eukprot:XP_018653049.1 putative ubiquitin-protein ligase BRE1 [Schistosoma mansoni]
MKHDDDDYDLNNDSSYTPKLIGIATVDLTTLSHLFSDPIHSTNNEFNQIYGWYHVLNNDTGCPSGQILIGVKPLINIGQQHLTNYYSSSLNNNEFTTNNNFSSLSHNIKPFGNYSIFQYGLNSTLSNCDLAKSTHSLNDCNTGKVSDDILVNKEESNHSELNRSVLFENLRTRLNELDEINTKLKNRLNLSTSNEKFFSHADNNTTDIDKNYNDDTNMKNESFFNQSSQNKLQSLNEEIDYSTLVNDLSLSQHQPHYSQHLADLHANDENMLYVNSKFQCTVLQSQLNHDSDDNTYFTHKINDDFTINKFINQCNHHFTIDDCSFTNSTNENIDCLISNSLKQSTENGRLNTMEKDNDNNNIDVESALTNDGDNDDDAHNKENIVNTDKDDEQSEISVVSPLLHDQSSNISDAHDYNDDEDIISIGTDIQHITSCNEISREGGGSYDTDCNNDEKKLEEDNVKQLHNNNNDSRSSNKIVHNESEQYSPMNNKLSHTEINNVLTELLNQKSLSETSASSVCSLYTRSTITQSPPSIDNQSIRQVEVSLTNSQNIQMNKPIISHEHELTQNRIIQNKNIDPLRNRLNNRLSEAVLYTMNTTMTDSNPQTNNNANLIINDTLSAFITNGYKTRSLKKAERVFNMTFK